jgi:tetratricopeptide (TPR) repeat protein
MSYQSALRVRLVILVALVAVLTACASPSESTGAQAAPTAASASPTPTFLTRISNSVDAWDKAIFGLVTFVLKAIATVVAIGLIVWLVKEIKRDQLVVPDLNNSSGDATLDKMVDGLSQLGRERLIRQMESLDRVVKDHIKRVGPTSLQDSRQRDLDAMPFPKELPTDLAKDIGDALKDADQKQAGAVVRMLGLVIGRRRTTISGILQRGSWPRAATSPPTRPSERLGITLEIADLANTTRTLVRTVWETPPIALTPTMPVTPVLAQAEPRADATADQHPPTLHDALIDAGLPPELASVVGDWLEGFGMLRQPILAQVLASIAERRQAVADPKQVQAKEGDAAAETAARALHAIGQVYEAAGAFTQARSQYEEALKKLQTYQPALDSLRGVLRNDRPIATRYAALFDPASRWIAVELLRRKMEVPPKTVAEAGRSRYQAQVHNFIGALNLANGQTSAPFFYDLAEQDFRRASELQPDWHAPYQNLGDTFRFRTATVAPGDQSDLAREALLQYETAWARAGRIQDGEIQRLVKRQITMAEIRAVQLVPDYVPEDGTALQMPDLSPDWDVAGEQDLHLLYRLATTYAVGGEAIGRPEENLRKARRFLAYCLTRDTKRTLWPWADYDSDLEAVRVGLKQLKHEIARGSIRGTDFSKVSGPELEAEVDRILARCPAYWPPAPAEPAEHRPG